MPSTRMTSEKLETFVNDVLRNDLAKYDQQLKMMNAEIMEYVQLKNMCQVLNSDFPDGFKTRVNIGANMFMQAKVDEMDKILVDVGLKHYLEFSPEEAVKFCDFKIKVLTKQADVVRDECIKTKAHIKLALLCLGEKEKFYSDTNG